MTRRKRFQPTLESLERLQLLSGVTDVEVDDQPNPEILQTNGTPSVEGVFTGRYFFRRQVPDVPVRFNLRGFGVLTSLGRFGVAGNVNSVGFVREAQATGGLSLSNPKGQILLSLIGPPQGASDVPPNSFSFTVTGGTGIYRGIRGNGVVGVGLRPPTTPNPGFGKPIRGQFGITIVFNSIGAA